MGETGVKSERTHCKLLKKKGGGGEIWEDGCVWHVGEMGVRERQKTNKTGFPSTHGFSPPLGCGPRSVGLGPAVRGDLYLSSTSSGGKRFSKAHAGGGSGESALRSSGASAAAERRMARRGVPRVVGGDVAVRRSEQRGGNACGAAAGRERRAGGKARMAPGVQASLCASTFPDFRTLH